MSLEWSGWWCLTIAPDNQKGMVALAISAQKKSHKNYLWEIKGLPWKNTRIYTGGVSMLNSVTVDLLLWVHTLKAWDGSTEMGATILSVSFKYGYNGVH